MDKKPQRIAKENIVSRIAGDIKENSVMLLIDYKGITVNDDTAFRRSLREGGMTYYVAKNTFIKLAAHQEEINDLDSYLEGTTAVVFGNDPVALAKAVSDFAKDHPAIKVKAGYMDGAVLPAEKLDALAKLPSKEVLLAQVVGGMQAPLTGFAVALQGLLRNLVYVLDQVKEQKSA
ncbi:MAG: 50S ribosomal protein L10 [Bacillota bacterium]|jgi:large subunit ribosomal protein L10